ncbi:metallophosphoesterase [bacterium]|nr:metallophosphoesterase [bacterium]
MTYLLGEWLSHQFGIIIVKRIGAVILGCLSISVAVATAGYALLLLQIPGPTVAQWALTSIAAMGIWGILNATRVPKLTRVNLIHPTKSPLGLTIVHLTDIHLDGITSTQWVRQLVNQVNVLSPDIVVFTGDLLDIHPDRIPEQIELLKYIRAKTAKLAVSGNHDFYMAYPTYQSVLESIGFTLIDNQHHHVAGIDFVGISDRDGRRFGHHRPDVDAIFSGVPQEGHRIALSHRPDEFHHFARHGVLLQLSGHTHWGQLPPFDFVIRMWYAHGRGHGQLGESRIYVSKGTGVWGPPMRLFGRSEIVVVTV